MMSASNVDTGTAVFERDAAEGDVVDLKLRTSMGAADEKADLKYNLYSYPGSSFPPY